MIGERKGSKILSCTHAGRVITLVPVAEVFLWHLDPLFIMHQIIHGGVGAAWQNRHLHLRSPHSPRPRETNVTYKCHITTFNEETYFGIRKNTKRNFACREDAEVRNLKDGICVPSLKTNLLIFVIILQCHINQSLCLKHITHCLL